MAQVTPIPKGIVSSDPAKFRPISLLSVLGKLLETHVKNILLEHFGLCAPLSDLQWRFTSGKSTTGALWLPRTTDIKHLTLEVRFVQYFFTIVRPLTLCHIDHSSLS